MFSASSNVLDAKQEPETNSKRETVGEEHKGSSRHEDSPAARGSRLFTGEALSPSSFLPPSRNKLPDSLPFCAGFALPRGFYVDSFQGDRDTREVCLVIGGILIQQLVTAGAVLMLTPMAGEEAQRGALGCSRLISS